MCKAKARMSLNYKMAAQKNVVEVIRTVHKVGGPPPSITKPQSKPIPKAIPQLKPQIKTPPNSPRPDFLEPLSPSSTTQKKNEEEMKERIKAYWDWQMEQPGFWEEKIEQLEKSREKYNRKGAWSANDLVAVNAIDAELEYCWKNLYELLEEYDADSDETI